MSLVAMPTAEYNFTFCPEITVTSEGHSWKLPAGKAEMDLEMTGNTSPVNKQTNYKYVI